ncbi:MAG: PDZ domain-containing protein, partial [Pirellula sp.]|nr:PDZ domain-containing protein [Pirellula sp.]
GGLAERSGLRAGDVIVSVAGTQVGLVNGRVIDAVYEMSGRASSSGLVSIMVLKASTRLLTPMTINVHGTTEARAIVTGRVFLGNSATYGGGSVKVELTNISKPYLSASGGNTYLPVVGSGPFPFTISFNAKYANAGDLYRLTATYYNVYRQIVAFANLDIPAPVPGTMVSYDLNLEQSAISSTVGSVVAGSIPVSNSYAGYYTPQQNVVDDTFRQLLGRNPSASEAQAWYQQMASGAMSVNELKAELLASPAFYDRAGDNPDVFVQQMIEMTTRLPAGRDELQYWRSRLASLGGNRLELCREYMMQSR